MGGSVAYIALIATLYGRTGSAAWVSAALFAGVAGSVIGAPGAGYVGDRFERRRVMIATDLVSAAVAGAMALVVDEPNALVAATTSAGYLLGPLVGGLLLGVGVSTPVLFAADAASFVVSAVFVAS